MTFHPYVVRSVFLALALQLLVIGVRHKFMKVATKVAGFDLLGLNNDYGRILKGVRRGLSPLAAHANCGFSDPAHALWWVPEVFPLLYVKPEIVGVAGTNMQWGHFVCHSSSQKRESTAFDLILQSAW